MKFLNALRTDSRRRNILLICGVAFLLFLAATFAIYGKTSAARRDEIAQYNRLQADSAALKSKNQAYLTSVMKSQFTPDQLAAILQKNSTYSMTVDGSAVKKNESVHYLQDNQTTAVFHERFSEQSAALFPSNLISSNLNLSKNRIGTFLKISATEKYALDFVPTADGLDVSVRFQNLKAGDILTFQFTPKFAKLLGLDQNIYEMIYNKTGN